MIIQTNESNSRESYQQNKHYLIIQYLILFQCLLN